MVDRVVVPPEVVGRERQHTEQEAKALVCPDGLEERAMATIMEDDERPHQKTRCGNREQERQPVRNIERAIHGVPQHAKRYQRIRDLPGTPPLIGELVLGNNRLPVKLFFGHLALRDDSTPCRAFKLASGEPSGERLWLRGGHAVRKHKACRL
jgi:hypothetical protein